MIHGLVLQQNETWSFIDKIIQEPINYFHSNELTYPKQNVRNYERNRKYDRICVGDQNKTEQPTILMPSFFNGQ